MKKKKISILCDVYRPIPYGYPICRSSDMNRCAPVFFRLSQISGTKYTFVCVSCGLCCLSVGSGVSVTWYLMIGLAQVIHYLLYTQICVRVLVNIVNRAKFPMQYYPSTYLKTNFHP